VSGRAASQEPADQAPRLARYEVRVRTRVSDALVASLPVPVTPTVVPRATLRRLWIRGDADLAQVVAHLAARGVEVHDILPW
jgi:hypothetical protein